LGQDGIAHGPRIVGHVSLARRSFPFERRYIGAPDLGGRRIRIEQRNERLRDAQ